MNVKAVLESALRDLSEGRVDEAARKYQGLIQENPTDARLINLYGFVAIRKARYKDAVTIFRRAAELDPGFAEAHVNLSNALWRTGDYEGAESAALRAIEIAPDLGSAHGALGAALTAQGRDEAAEKALERAVALVPDNPMIQTDYAAIERDLGKFENSMRACRATIAAYPDYIPAYYDLSRCKKFTSDDPDTGLIEQALNPDSKLGRSIADNAEWKALAYMAVSKVYEDTGRFEESFQYLLKGNALRRENRRFDEEQDIDVFSVEEKVFVPSFFETFHGCGDPSTAPIFIVGMPRSGTTLIEQIISRHPRVAAAGELEITNRLWGETLERAGATLKDPASIATTDPAYWTALGGRYIQRVREICPDSDFVTDKLPHNFLHLGFIHTILPNAHIVHCRRDPMATCLSIFQAAFSRGHFYSYDLGELGRHYLRYHHLMEHWRRTLPRPMIEVDYEDLVENTEAATRRVIGGLGLAWDARCLEHDKNRGEVKTASAWQVRQPIYQESIERWRHYERQLQPLLDVLRPILPDTL